MLNVIWALYFPFLSLTQHSILNSIRPDPDNIDMTFACIRKNMSDLLGAFTLKKKKRVAQEPEEGVCETDHCCSVFEVKGVWFRGSGAHAEGRAWVLGEWLHRIAVNWRASAGVALQTLYCTRRAWELRDDVCFGFRWDEAQTENM